MLIARANIATPTQGSTIITVLTFYIRLQFERVLLYITTIYIHIKQNIRESAPFNITTVSSKVLRQEAARVWSERGLWRLCTVLFMSRARQNYKFKELNKYVINSDSLLNMATMLPLVNAPIT